MYELVSNSVEVAIYLKINFGIPNKETGFFPILLH